MSPIIEAEKAEEWEKQTFDAINGSIMYGWIVLSGLNSFIFVLFQKLFAFSILYSLLYPFSPGNKVDCMRARTKLNF